MIPSLMKSQTGNVIFVMLTPAALHLYFTPTTSSCTRGGQLSEEKMCSEVASGWTGGFQDGPVVTPTSWS